MLESLSHDKYQEHCKVSPDNTLYPTWLLFGKVYVKTKELGPVGGRDALPSPQDPPLHTQLHSLKIK